MTPESGLRGGLVDDDEETRLEARRMVRTERDDWALEVYHPDCPVREALGPEAVPRPNPPEGRDRRSRRPDIVLIGLPNREASRLPCMRRAKSNPF